VIAKELNVLVKLQSFNDLDQDVTRSKQFNLVLNQWEVGAAWQDRQVGTR
jgi:hypothetical protein